MDDDDEKMSMDDKKMIMDEPPWPDIDDDQDYPYVAHERKIMGDELLVMMQDPMNSNELMCVLPDCLLPDLKRIIVVDYYDGWLGTVDQCLPLVREGIAVLADDNPWDVLTFLLWFANHLRVILKISKGPLLMLDQLTSIIVNEAICNEAVCKTDDLSKDCYFKYVRSIWLPMKRFGFVHPTNLYNAVSAHVLRPCKHHYRTPLSIRKLVFRIAGAFLIEFNEVSCQFPTGDHFLGAFVWLQSEGYIRIDHRSETVQYII